MLKIQQSPISLIIEENLDKFYYKLGKTVPRWGIFSKNFGKWENIGYMGSKIFRSKYISW